MSEEQAFGQVIRARRKARNVDQRTLAARIEERLRAGGGGGFDVTYLSKIENGRLPPPSARVIAELAAELELDEYELIALAGKVPPQVGKTLQESPGARMFYRSAREMNLSEEEWRALLDELKRRREQP
ncbi:MAG: helix-turn-helix domain-containing protein [Chloroflexi bacterium]|nr:helix-turn-helix domain-containing protein [Chloroflexota bacterium]